MSELTKEQLLEYVKKQKLKMKKLETEIATLKEKAPTDGASSADSDATALRSEVELLERQLAAKDGEINALSKAVEDSEDEKIKVVAQKNAEIAALSDQIASFKTAASNASTQHAQISELEAAVTDLKGKLEQAQGVAAAAEAVRVALEGRWASVREELEASRSSASALEAQLTASRTALEALQEREDGSGAAVEELRAKLAAAQEAERLVREALSAETTNHANSLAQLDAELNRVRTELESADAARASLTASAEQVRADAASKAEQLAVLAAENKDLQTKLATFASATNTAAATSTVRSATPPPEPVTAGGNGKKKGKNKKNKGKAGSTEVAEAADAADVADETGSVGDGPANVEVAALEAQLAEGADRERALTEQIQRLQQQLSESCTRADAAAGEVGSLRGELARLQAEAATAAEVAETAASSTAAQQAVWLSEKASLDAQVQTLTNEVQSAQERLEGGASKLEEELRTLREQLETSSAALSAANEARASAEQQLADLRGELAAVAEERDSVQKISAMQKDALGHASDTIGQMKTAAEAMRNEISNLRSASIAAASGTDSVVEALRAEMAQQTAALQSAEESRAALEVEISALKETAAQADIMTKKLTLKLKQKMKECTDAAAELAAQKELVTKLSSSEESSKTALSEQLQAALAGRASDKSEFEAKLKSSNDALIAGEERISGILREKNKLQEDLFASLHKVESATKESHAFKVERDQARQQYLDVETKLQTLSASTREKIDALTVKVTDLTAANGKLTSQVSTATEALALSNSEITTLKENATALAQAKEKLKAQNAAVEALKQQLAETKADAEAKAEAANERNKKLKQLLAKVNAMAQEKESKLVQFQSMTDRAKKFNIVTRIGVVAPQDPTGQVLEWCLIYEHRAAPAVGAGKAGVAEENKEADALPQYRWIEQRVAHKWVAEGSTLVGAWPHPVQETWAAEMAVLRTRLEAERDEITAKYEETSSQFQAYKVRAQTALKRIGNEDRNEKLKAQEAENAEIEKLRAVIQELKEKEAEFALTAGAQDRNIAALEKTIEELRGQVDVLENTIADGEQTQKANERRISMLQKEIETLQEDSRVMKEQYEVADRNNREKRLQQMRAEEEAALRLVKKANADAAAVAAARAASPGVDASNAAVSVSEAADPASSTVHVDGAAAPQRAVSRAPSQTITTPSPRGRPLAVEAALTTELQQDGADSKLLLFQQADSMLKDSILVLRQENALLMVEINELKNDLGLREDQVNTLKSTVRELESSLCREKEFNAENRRINADYLVNILRNFLMSTDPSERAKLVPVLCQILHLRPDESKVIAEKWAVRGGGLVGWLLPQRPPPAAPSAPMRYQAHASGMSIDRGGAGNGKSSAGDLTYDPSTGAGIDVNGY